MMLLHMQKLPFCYVTGGFSSEVLYGKVTPIHFFQRMTNYETEASTWDIP